MSTKAGNPPSSEGRSGSGEKERAAEAPEKQGDDLPKELCEDEVKYRCIVENSSDLMMLTLPDGTISYLSRACESVLGYLPEDLTGKQAWICHPEDLKRVKEVHHRALAGERGTDFEYRIVTKIGVTKWVSHSWSPILKNSAVQMIVSVVRDITERKEAEQALHYQLEFEELITGISRDFLMLPLDEIDRGIDETLRAIGEFAGVDCGYLFLFIHDEKGFENTHTWFSEETMPHTKLSKMLTDYDLPFLIKRLREFETVYIPDVGALPGKTISKREALLLDGVKTLIAIPLIYNQSLFGFLRFDAVRSAIAWPEEIIALLKIVGQIVVSAIMHKKMEEELFMTRKYESIGLFVEGIANDFSNLLNDMAGHLYIAKGLVEKETKIHKSITEAEHAMYLAKDLMSQLRTLAILRESLRRILNIGHLIEDAATLALGNSNVRCFFQISPELWPIHANEDQMRQVIHNIVINAKEAISGKGIVRVSAENILNQGEYDLPLKGERYVRISIEDRGVGIPGVNLQKIFDPYFTTKQAGAQKGIGLGLTICYAVVRSHNGFISVESRMGVGTTFHIYLPAAAAEEEGGEETAAGRGRVLVMDDEEIDRTVAGEILKHLAYEPELARNGEEAIELYKKRKESGQPFGAVILDLLVNTGMGGEETMRRLLEMDPGVKGIVCSGYSSEFVFENFRQYGFRAVLPKPYSIAELQSVLDDVLHEGSDNG